MLPYVVVFLINFYLAYQSERKFFKDRHASLLYLIVLIILNSVFVGLRDFGVGIDTLVYIDDYFIEAKYSGLQHIFFDGGQYDVGFLFLAKVASLISDDSQMLLILTELVIMGFTIIGAFEFKKTMPRLNFVWFLILFSAGYYYHSENLMRQFCAMAVSFFAFSQFKQKRYLAYALFQVVGISFHSSSILFMLIPIYDFVSKIEGGKKYGISALAFCGFIFAFAGYYYVITMLGHMGLINEIYAERYGEDSVYEAGTGISFRYVLEYVVPLFMVYYAKRKKVLSPGNFYMLLVLFVSMFCFEQLRYISRFLFRLGFYFGLIYFAYMAMALNTKKIESLVKFLFVAFMYVNSYYTIVWQTSQKWKWGYEYTSKILGL